MVFGDSDAVRARKSFPLLKKPYKDKPLIYLDNAATTQKPQAVIDAVDAYYADINANVHRGIYGLSQDATRLYDAARKEVASFIGVSEDEIIFTKGTTESLNMLAYTLHHLCEGRDEIVLTEMEHHANLVPWQQLAKRTGMKLKFIAMKDDFTLDYGDAEKKITKKTAIVSIVHVSNALGTVNDVQRIASFAHEQGAYCIVDAAQSITHMPIDARKIGCDFLVFSGHKMYGPMGIGVLYGKQEILKKLPPFQHGGDMIGHVSYEDASWAEVPTRFEAGTPNVAGAIGLKAAIEYIRTFGIEAIHAWEQELLSYTKRKLNEQEGITLYSPKSTDDTSGLIAFNLDGIHGHDVAGILDEHNVCIRAGHHCAMPLMEKLDVAGTCRISVALYNTMEDIDRCIEAIQKVQEIFR
jgi:cysteine desulfurase/selenocysteine lyase